MATDTKYTSQLETIRNELIAYLKDPANWPDGIPKLTDFTPGSIIYTLLSAVAVAIDTLGLAIFLCRSAAYMTTATDGDLDNKVADYALQRNQATSAHGIFTFYRNNATEQEVIIPLGTAISTWPDSNGNVVTFMTTEDGVIPANELSVDVTGLCDEPGAGGNIPADTPLLISSTAPGADGVRLGNSIANGFDQETDTALRSRGLAAYLALAYGTNVSYQETVLSVDGIVSATIVPQNRGPGTVDIFVIGPNNSIPPDDLIADAQALIEEKRVASDDVRVLPPEIVIISPELEIVVDQSYDEATVAEAVKLAVENYILNLGMSAGVLGYVYESQLIAVAMTIKGVQNVTTSFSNTRILPHHMPVPGAILVTVG